MTAPSFRPSGWRPFGGDCQAWELVTRNLRTNAIEPPVDGGSSGRTLMCLHEGDLVPLWLWTGTRDGGGLLIERTSASPDLPGLEGTPLAPVAYDLHGWSEVPSPLPLLGGTLAPPSDNAADWAGQVAGLVKAAYTSPEFLLYRRASATPATMLAWLRTPYGTTLTVLGIPIPPHGVSSTFDYQHALFVTDGKQTEFQEFVGNRGGPEQPDTTVATTGSTSEDMDFRITASSAPLLPGAGAVMAQLNPFLPATQGQLVFSLFNLTRSDYWFGPSPLLVLWKAQTECNSNHPSLIVVDAQRGFLRSYEERVTACQESAGLKAAVPLFALGGLNHSLWGRTTPP
jgi:hypothetical protein